MATKDEKSNLSVFNEHESEVRSYCRNFPTIFVKAKGHLLWGKDGKEYIDFFAGAGALNYGHNHPKMKEKLIEHIEKDGVTHGLDMATDAKEDLIKRLQEIILKPRNMDYKIMFPGPTGTNAVESALKLARKVTGREKIMNFTNAFHGMTLGALAVTGNESKRQGAGVSLPNTVVMPFDNFFGDGTDTAQYIERFFENKGSGVSIPAAIILETVQGEGGINVASFEWIKRIGDLCKKWGIFLIIDDIQAGVGRTGPFFSFEPAGVDPDIICLSKSIGGYGLPFALTLMKPEHDIFNPGEHNGTFRGNNLAFVTATEALNFWEDDSLTKEVARKGEKVHQFLKALAEKYPELHGHVRGRGLMQGLVCDIEGLTNTITATAFEKGLISETAGMNDEVIKVMPPLTIDDEALDKGLAILEESIKETLSKKG
ncbi:diaminobutyrate--2-oxoglutarate transaminase [Salipaludibacillus neizhouensis]|uniref:Diaminobutyrate--2-oxoglutarate transaminase n=1 Tax=Salipaludibacillus neizhouensis TaxID=885475 RepID=A0A3A9KFB0_9BACI|nr:diaminobutyrate--2-oxoglutarate transaminase [Salipaludibacillus neizhouensis]RKL66275.1 diaminobutyrate--2-oxoglutarate transaminase [Salipaludibacillus neizhouensis]